MNPILFICNNDFTCTFLWWWIITLVQNIVSRFKTSNFIKNYKNKQKQNYSHKKPPIPTNPTAKQLNQKFDSFKTNLSSRKNGKKNSRTLTNWCVKSKIEEDEDRHATATMLKSENEERLVFDVRKQKKEFLTVSPRGSLGRLRNVMERERNAINVRRNGVYVYLFYARFDILRENARF